MRRILRRAGAPILPTAAPTHRSTAGGAGPGCGCRVGPSSCCDQGRPLPKPRDVGWDQALGVRDLHRLLDQEHVLEAPAAEPVGELRRPAPVVAGDQRVDGVSRALVERGEFGVTVRTALPWSSWTTGARRLPSRWWTQSAGARRSRTRCGQTNPRDRSWRGSR